MKTLIKSPFSGGNALLLSEKATLTYKGGSYEVIQRYYECQDSHERFQSPEQVDEVLLQVRTQHKQKTHVDERIDCPGCGESLAFNEAWRGTGNACKYCGYC
jgi:hypothetical protein